MFKVFWTVNVMVLTIMRGSLAFYRKPFAGPWCRLSASQNPRNPDLDAQNGNPGVLEARLLSRLTSEALRSRVQTTVIINLDKTRYNLFAGGGSWLPFVKNTTPVKHKKANAIKWGVPVIREHGPEDLRMIEFMILCNSPTSAPPPWSLGSNPNPSPGCVTSWNYINFSAPHRQSSSCLWNRFMRSDN